MELASFTASFNSGLCLKPRSIPALLKVQQAITIHCQSVIRKINTVFHNNQLQVLCQLASGLSEIRSKLTPINFSLHNFAHSVPISINSRSSRLQQILIPYGNSFFISLGSFIRFCCCACSTPLLFWRLYPHYSLVLIGLGFMNYITPGEK